jgi:hypothetical protein
MTAPQRKGGEAIKALMASRRARSTRLRASLKDRPLIPTAVLRTLAREGLAADRETYARRLSELMKGV